MPLLDPELRKAINRIRKALGGAPRVVQQIPDVMDLTDTIARIPPLKRSLRRELREVLELIDSGDQPELIQNQVAGLRQAVVDALQELRRPGGPPVVQDDIDD